MTAIRSIVAACLLLIALPAFAGEALDRLQAFTDDLRSFSAEFEQTRYDENQQPVRESSGMAYLQRPGKFRWDYQEPYNQVIVADGNRLWIYDADLEQVTVRKAKQALATAPIMLLSGEAPLSEQFEMRDLGQRERLHWVELQPKVDDSDFERIFLGLDDQGLRVMELRDRFDQTTQIRFSEVRMNSDIDPSRFEFEPPEGVDVVGEVPQG
jgi:outer membrane lipoprotein carrier protein